MKKTLLFVMVFVLALSGITFADVVYLKNGNKITGQIIERTDQQMKINVKGVDLTYFNDEVERVETDGAATPSQAPTPEIKAPTSTPLPSSQELLKNPTPPIGRSADPALNSLGKEDLIIKLIEVSGAKENMRVMFDKMLKESPPDEAALLGKILNLEEIVQVLVPVYDKHFLVDELKELVSFYESPVGIKLLKATPDIVQDSMKASMAYFQKKIEEQGGGPQEPNTP